MNSSWIQFNMFVLFLLIILGYNISSGSTSYNRTSDRNFGYQIAKTITKATIMVFSGYGDVLHAEPDPELEPAPPIPPPPPPSPPQSPPPGEDEEPPPLIPADE